VADFMAMTEQEISRRYYQKHRIVKLAKAKERYAQKNGKKGTSIEVIEKPQDNASARKDEAWNDTRNIEAASPNDPRLNFQPHFREKPAKSKEILAVFTFKNVLKGKKPKEIRAGALAPAQDFETV
jgi:hypothetical protein